MKSLIALALFLIPLTASAVDQPLTLRSGWNAIWLEVAPQDANGRAAHPNLAFDLGTNVDLALIASPKPLAGLAEVFGVNPGSENGVFNQASWEVWRRVDPAGANNLVTVTGNRAYLIQNTGAPFVLNVTGGVRFHRHEWTADRYNLFGFGLNASPSFDEFFGPSGGRHLADQIFTLAADGNWNPVSPSAPMSDGVAYWIFSNGPSDYMGPVSVALPSENSLRLSFGAGEDLEEGLGLDLEEIVFTNLGTSEVTPELELIVADPGAGSLDLFNVNPNADTLGYQRGNQIDSTADNGTSTPLGETVAAGGTTILTLGAQRSWTTGAVGRQNIYRLSTGGGNQVWLPVTARNGSLQAPEDLLPESDVEKVAGLWVGDIIMDSATSIVVDGSPEQTTSGSAPIRLILHSDDAGQVTLLSQVTVMQTRTADATIAPDPVLVINPAQIPFFEGIRERGGSRVGLRLEAVTFDMPRRLDAQSQAALLSDPAFPGLVEEGLNDFLIGRSLRPPSLAESYHFSWPLTGAIGAGKTCRTDEPLTLDPFHRSNPFRHAFHQRHARGEMISRAIEIIFENGSSPDRLEGRYRETIGGLTREPLTVSGNLTLRRVSTVAALIAE